MRWGPVEPDLPREVDAYPVANDACAASYDGTQFRFAGGRIDALVACDGAILRTAEPDSVGYGLAQVRRRVSTAALELLHVIFAPIRPRPILFGLVVLWNHAGEPTRVDYTETWSVEGDDIRAADGACVCNTPHGRRALAEASLAVRARVPEPPPERGLALWRRLVIPAGAQRWLHFAYAAPPDEEDPAALVRAWRGDVAHELERAAAAWLVRVGGEPGAIEGYRRLQGSNL